MKRGEVTVRPVWEEGAALEISIHPTEGDLVVGKVCTVELGGRVSWMSDELSRLTLLTPEEFNRSYLTRR